jgi:Protein of unknown function (DUF3800)
MTDEQQNLPTYNVYCDESRLDLINSTISTNKYMVIGSIWIPRSHKEDIIRLVRAWKQRHSLSHREIKWTQISRANIDKYLELIDLLFDSEKCKYRAILIDARKIDMRYHNEDPEEAFYKMYYQLLCHPISRNHSYYIYLDGKTNKVRNRVATLQHHLSKRTDGICKLSEVQSSSNLITQLADLFTGAISASANTSTTSAFKLRFIEELERRINRKACTPNTAAKKDKIDIFLFPSNADNPLKARGECEFPQANQIPQARRI